MMKPFIPHTSWRSVASKLAVAGLAFVGLSLSAFAQDSNYTVEVCPKALWKDAIFLRGPSSPETFANVTKWKQDQVRTYVTERVLPQAQFNIAMIIVALFALLMFLLWRLFRRCCLCCCMRRSCEERRNQADPKKVLSGWGYWIQKGLLLLVAVTALCMMLAGIIMAPKLLFGKVWGPVNRLTSYLNDTTTDMKGLVASLDGIKPVLDNLTYLVNNDINLPLIKTSLQSISTTLDSAAANPNTVVNALNDLNASMASVRSQVASLRPQLGPSGLPASLTTLQAGLPGMSTVVAACQNYSMQLAGLDTPMTGLNTATGPPYDATSLEAAMAAVEVDSWRSSLGPVVDALDVWRSLRSGNTLGALAADVTALNATVADLKGAKVPASAAALLAFAAAWSGVTASLKKLLDQVAYVQANVARLDEPSNRAIQRLQKVYGDVSTFAALQPSPASLAANLTALAGEVSLGPVGTLVSDLNSAQAAINAVQQAVLDDARSALGNLKTMLDSLSPHFASTRSNLTAYKDSSTQTTFDALKASAVAASTTWDLSKAAKTLADTAAANASVLAVQAAASSGTLGPLATSAKTGMAAVDTALAATDAALAARPPLGPYLGVTTSVKSVYDSMPSPKSQELSAVNSAIATVENLLVQVPATVRSQTNSIQSSFGSGVDQLRTKVVVKAEDFEADNDDKVESFDLARYRATCALLGVTAALIALLIVVAAINCPWGLGCAVFFLLLLTALLFLLASVFAVVLAVAQDGCYHSEHIVLESLGSGSTVTPLASYYFFGATNSSVKGVLKSANLVDIDKVTGQVTDLADSMISNFTAQFQPQVKLAAIITDVRGFVNHTLWEIDSLLNMTGVSAVRPVYLDLKSFPCCEVTDYSFKLWTVLTAGGWLILIASGMAMGFLARLDQLPQSGCCGCKPLIGKRLDAKVHPEGEGGGEGAGDEEGAVKAIAVAPGQQTMVMTAGDATAQPPPSAVAVAVYPPPPPQTPEAYAAYPPPPGAYYPPPPPAAYLPPPPPAVYPPPPPIYSPVAAAPWPEANANTNVNEANR